MHAVSPKAVARVVGPPLVEVFCAYEVAALEVRGTRLERYMPTLSCITHRYRGKFRDPRFWASLGVFAWLVHHLWIEQP